MFPVWGDFEAKFKNDGATITTKAVMGQQTLPNGRNVLGITLKDFDFGINSDNLDITLSGTLLADFIDFFVWLLKWIIVPILRDSINSSIPQAVTKSFNAYLASGNGMLDVDLGQVVGSSFVLGVDVAFTAPPVVLGNQL